MTPGTRPHPGLDVPLHGASARARTPCYVDDRTGRRFDIATPFWCSPDDGGPLSLIGGPGIARSQVIANVRSQWRYRAALPIDFSLPVSLGEGCTPLVSPHPEAPGVSYKLEFLSPTGSFKDRGASVLVSYLKQIGVKRVVEDSSGNGGGAIAAYGAAAGLDVTVFAPLETSAPKLAQMQALGARIVPVAGGRIACQDAAVSASHLGVYAGHNWQPFFLQGTKLIAYEMWEDLGFSAPDNVVMPLGGGSNLLGCATGFGELLRAGAIDRLPRLFGVQAANCAPVHAAFSGEKVVEPGSCATVAAGADIARPPRLEEIVSALGRSRGGTLALDEAEIVGGVRLLATLGLHAEPTAAMAAAGARRLLQSGVIGPTQRTIVILTGRGITA